MKKYLIISTYPEKGSQNIGDALITNSLVSALAEAKGIGNFSIEVVWRESQWEEIKDKVSQSDAIIFACLALRVRMHEKEYPTIEKIIESGKPIGVISAGTSFLIGNMNDKLIFETFSAESINALKKINEKALFFTTRGILTQRFCNFINLNNSIFSGDIAFYDNRFNDRLFIEKRKVDIKKIAISDPHNAKLFIPLFKRLVQQVKTVFPDAEIVCLIHGKNPDITKVCEAIGINYKEIYKNKENGLDEYDNYDLHVGFRVHGHVSALKRRVFSYLIEQDGRGCDYGLTFSRKITVPSHISSSFDSTKLRFLFENIIRKILGYNPKSMITQNIDVNSADQIVSIIDHDSMSGFSKFQNLENEINSYSKNCLDQLRKLP